MIRGVDCSVTLVICRLECIRKWSSLKDIIIPTCDAGTKVEDPLAGFAASRV